MFVLSWENGESFGKKRNIYDEIVKIAMQLRTGT